MCRQAVPGADQIRYITEERGLGMMATDPRVAAIREELPVLARQVYLNSGTCGPLPRRTHEAIVQAAERQFLDGRAAFKPYMEEYFPLRVELRERSARLLGAAP